MNIIKCKLCWTWFASAVLLFAAAAPAALRFDFNVNLQGWTDLTQPNLNTGPRNWAVAPPAYPSATQAGAGAVGQSIVGGNQDSAHPTLWLRSPEFKLAGSGDLTLWLYGGSGSGSLTGTNTAAVRTSSASPGFQGVALVAHSGTNAGTFVLSARKSGNSNSWEQLTFTAAQLAALDLNAIYTLDLIDAGHGSWGGVAMDSVSIPGALATADAWDTYSDTWVATDGLGRALPTYDEVGPPKTNRAVGMFYFLWLNGGPVYDITQILATNPTNPPWGPRWSFHFWGRPLFDYYRSNDRYVLRKHAQMLTDAGVDALFLDVSNGFTYDAARQTLCEEFETLRLTGHRVPKLSFLPHSSMSNTVQSVYDNFYAPPLYPELWFNWKGRPIMLARASDVNPALQNFFNFRYSWAWDPGQDKWQWIDNHPQRIGWHENPAVAEEIPVCVAQHPTSNIGRSFHAGAQPPLVQQAPAVGLCFAEQWTRALAVGAEMTFITGWNEWIAQRFITGLDGSPSFLGAPPTNGATYFVDQYNQEYSRDIEPMNGGHGDNYYYQLIANVRRLKGVRPLESVRSRPIAIDGTFADWTSVGPEYRDHRGDPTRRNHPGFNSAVTLMNNSGRNDLAVAKVSADATNVCFYVRTVAPLSAPATNWMVLFIDADSNPQTGWLGYDLVVNRTPPTNGWAIVEQNRGGSYAWTNPVAIPIRFAGNELELALPRALVGAGKFDFKWADNILQTGNWGDFTLNGDAAPNDRFNYRARFTLAYGFEDGTLQGWTDLTPANGNTGPRNWALSPPAFPGSTQSGAGAVGQNIVGGTQDSSHPTLWLRSPEFHLNGAGDLSAWLRGGTGNGSLTGEVVSAVPANSSSPGFQGVALRNVNTGRFVLSGAKPTSGDAWEQISFSSAQLAALDQEAVYTLDLIDAGHGGWGWMALDAVTIPGAPYFATNSAPTISNVTDRLIKAGTSTGPINFTVGDLETAAASLTVAGSSSNTNVVPSANVVFGGSGSNRTVTVTAAPSHTGTATLTLTVSDGNLTASDTFVVTVGKETLAIDPVGAVPDGYALVREWHWNANGNLEGWTANTQLALAAGAPTGGIVFATSTDIDPMWFSPAALGLANTLQALIEFRVRKDPSDTTRMDLFWSDANGGFSGSRVTTLQAGALPLDGQFHVVRLQYAGLIAAPLAQLRYDPISDTPGIGKTIRVDYFRIYTQPPRLTVQRWPGNQVRLAWPALATAFTLQRSAFPASGFVNAGVTVTTEGSESVAYDTPGTAAQFYRLIR